MDEKPEITLDDRELKSKTARKLFELNASLRPQRLIIGDYILSDRVCVERKTSEDLESSIIDGRLFSQAKEMSAAYQAPIIAVIGSEYYRVQEKAVRGAMISLIIDYKIPILFFDSEEDLAEFLYATAFKEQFQEKREIKLQFSKKTELLSEQQQLIVESIPMIGPKNAKALLKHFGSVEKIFTASEKELQDCEGIGPLRAKEIKKVFTAAYETE
ncbi:hypothetical protein HUU53_00860 [Candidatus Micrarchaeota archaeon]|nr:hypothetical protein [Candidatus Micrarchaeota archaeon]